MPVFEFIFKCYEIVGHHFCCSLLRIDWAMYLDITESIPIMCTESVAAKLPSHTKYHTEHVTEFFQSGKYETAFDHSKVASPECQFSETYKCHCIKTFRNVAFSCDI